MVTPAHSEWSDHSNLVKTISGIVATPRFANQTASAFVQHDATYCDATGRDSLWPYRSSYVALMDKAENSWNSAPCSTRVPAECCSQCANLCGSGHGYR